MSAAGAAARLYRTGAWLFAGFTSIGLWIGLRMHWAEKVVFDGGTLFCAGVALSCWVRARQLGQP